MGKKSIVETPRGKQISIINPREQNIGQGFRRMRITGISPKTKQKVVVVGRIV